MALNSGQSRCVTPGLFPNPEVKTPHVGASTEVRESSGEPLRCYCSKNRKLYCIVFVTFGYICWFNPTGALNSGQSRCATPGLFPNPEVKTPHVGASTEVRESSGEPLRCYCSKNRKLYCIVFVTFGYICWFNPTGALNSGQSRCATPGLFPNPEVKTPHVGASTEVRESSGEPLRCYCSKNRKLYCIVFVTFGYICWFNPTGAFNSGQSRCATPGLFPNSEVKTPHVGASTEVRESSGEPLRCYCSKKS